MASVDPIRDRTKMAVVEIGATYRHHKGLHYVVVGLSHSVGGLLVTYESLATGRRYSRSLFEFTGVIGESDVLRYERVLRSDFLPRLTLFVVWFGLVFGLWSLAQTWWAVPVVRTSDSIVIAVLVLIISPRVARSRLARADRQRRRRAANDLSDTYPS